MLMFTSVQGDGLIRQVNLKNFQGFKGHQTSDFGGITLIFGPNSAGKSSIGRALNLMARQFETATARTVSKAERTSSTYLNHGFIESSLRTARETIYSQLSDASIEPVLEYGWSANLADDPYIVGIDSVRSCVVHRFDLETNTEHKEVSVEIVVSEQIRSMFPNRNRHLGEATITLVSDGQNAYIKAFDLEKTALLEALFYVNGAWGRYPNKYPQETLQKDWVDYKFTKLVTELVNFDDGYLEELLVFWENGIFACPPLIYGAHLLWGDVDTDYLDDEHLSHWPTRMEQCEDLATDSRPRISLLAAVCERALNGVLEKFENFTRVPSIREIPVSAEFVNRTPAQNPYKLLEDYGATAVGQALDLHRNRPADALERLTNKRYTLDTRFVEIPDSGIMVRLNQVIDKFSGAKLTFKEVGVGISQVVPVLEALYKGGLVYIEQPELHLHPRMQGDLMDLIVDQWVGTKESQIVLETHSESMLLRLQRRIRNGDISAQEVKVIFVEPVAQDLESPQSLAEPSQNSISNQMCNLELDNLGDVIDPFPISFAALRLEDLL